MFCIFHNSWLNFLVQSLISFNYEYNIVLFLHISMQIFRREKAECTRCAWLCVGSGGEPLSRPSFPGARFPEEREDAGARIPLALMCHDVHRPQGAGYTNVCTMPSQEPRKKLQLSPLPSHMVATLPPPRCTETRRDAMFPRPLRLLRLF